MNTSVWSCNRALGLVEHTSLVNSNSTLYSKLMYTSNEYMPRLIQWMGSIGSNSTESSVTYLWNTSMSGQRSPTHSVVLESTNDTYSTNSSPPPLISLVQTIVKRTIAAQLYAETSGEFCKPDSAQICNIPDFNEGLISDDVINNLQVDNIIMKLLCVLYEETTNEHEYNLNIAQWECFLSKSNI